METKQPQTPPAEARENIMGTMEINPLLVKLSVPMMISMLVQALYNVVDSVFVSHVSENALTAVSLAFSLQNVMIAVGVGTGVGVNAMLSKSLGEKNQRRANATAENGIFLSLCSFVVFLVIGLTCMKPYFYAQTGDEAIARQGIQYLSVCCIFSLGLFTQTMGEKLLAATGRTYLSMISQLTGAVVNIILDPILIFALNMGVRGAATATVISQAVGAVWVLRFLTGSRTRLRLSVKNMPLVGKVIGPCLGLGVSTFVMIATESILSISFNSSLARYGGDIAVGAMTIITSATQLLSMPVQGLCQGAQPIMSFNFGAGKGDRVKRAFRLQFVICVGYAVAFWAACMLVPQMFASVFSTDPELVQYTAWAMRVYMAGIFSTGFQASCQQSFVALGQAKISLFMACLRKLILLIPLIFILPLILQDKVFAVFLAEPVSDIIAATVTCSAFFIRFNKILATSQKKA
mgnify:CR=1 FL=1